MIIILGDVFMYMFLLILVVIYVLLQFSCFKKEKKARKIFRNGDFPLVFAHRGSSHLFPENTELAFIKSFEMGVDAFETDIRLTKDGKIITQHNEDIDETTDMVLASSHIFLSKSGTLSSIEFAIVILSALSKISSTIHIFISRYNLLETSSIFLTSS